MSLLLKAGKAGSFITLFDFNSHQSVSFSARVSPSVSQFWVLCEDLSACLQSAYSG